MLNSYASNWKQPNKQYGYDTLHTVITVSLSLCTCTDTDTSYIFCVNTILNPLGCLFYAHQRARAECNDEQISLYDVIESFAGAAATCHSFDKKCQRHKFNIQYLNTHRARE